MSSADELRHCGALLRQLAAAAIIWRRTGIANCKVRSRERARESEEIVIVERVGDTRLVRTLQIEVAPAAAAQTEHDQRVYRTGYSQRHITDPHTNWTGASLALNCRALPCAKIVWAIGTGSISRRQQRRDASVSPRRRLA